MGFGVVSLYGLWAAYGAAPGPLELLGGHSGHDEAGDIPDHGGHGAADGHAVHEFEAGLAEFIERFSLPDGSVRPVNEHAHHGMDHGPQEIFLLARRFSFEPGVLRLEAGMPYRLRMMAGDATHGASIHLGDASRIIRLRPGRPVLQELTFNEPGTYLVYCTVYCGTGHDSMQGRIVVEG